MSNVTEVVVHLSDPAEEVLAELQLPFFVGDELIGLRQVDNQRIFTGAFEDLDTDALARWFADLEWAEDSYATMSVSSRRGDCGFVMVGPSGEVVDYWNTRTREIRQGVA